MPSRLQCTLCKIAEKAEQALLVPDRTKALNEIATLAKGAMIMEILHPNQEACCADEKCPFKSLE